mgnify:FL=1
MPQAGASRSRRAALSAVVWLVASLLAIPPLAAPAGAILTLKAPGRNTTPPSGDLAGSGWDLQGKWGAGVGTPIAPRYFVTARHLGGRAGDTLELGGRSYTAQRAYCSRKADLCVWRVQETFPAFAPLHLSGGEVGRDVVLFGRGTARGRPITQGGRVCGWEWGPSDGALSWGTNRVEAILPGPGGAAGGRLLAFAFDRGGGENEACVSTGDSGGGVFLREGGQWRLVGVIQSVMSHLARHADGSGPVTGALFDTRGFFVAQPGKNGSRVYQRIPEVPRPQPMVAFAACLSDDAEFLRAVLDGRGDAYACMPGEKGRPWLRWLAAAAALACVVLTAAVAAALNRRGADRLNDGDSGR